MYNINMKINTKNKKKTMNYYLESHVYNKGGFVTTSFVLSMKMLKQINKVFKVSKNRDIINDPIKIFDIYIKDISFILSAYFILDLIYSKIILDDQERTQFILDNCLYGYFDNKYEQPHLFKIKMSLEILFEGFDLNILYKHIYIKNIKLFLNFVEDTNNMKFDVIVGNPPFQGKKKNNKSKTRMAGSVSILWKEFIKKANQLCKEGGYISLIHPSLWRRPEDSVRDIFWNNNLIYCDMNSLEEGKKIFKVMYNFDWYVMQKAEYSGTTIINDYNNKIYEINMKDWNFIPNHSLDIIKKAVSQDASVIYESSKFHSTKGSFEKTEEFKYPAFYSVTKKDGVKVKYFKNSKENTIHDQRKIIIPGTGYHFEPVGDWDNNLAVCQFSFAIPVKDKKEYDLIFNKIKSKNFKIILDALTWAPGSRDYKAFKSIDIKKINIEN